MLLRAYSTERERERERVVNCSELKRMIFRARETVKEFQREMSARAS